MASASFKLTPTVLPFTEEKIAARAREIFLQEGSVDGLDERNWFKAIEELTAESQIESAKPPDATVVAGRMPSRATLRGRNTA